MTSRVLSRAQVASFAEEMRQAGKTIVTTNGAFDLLHPGHLFLLAEAQKQGDILIVGVNSDARVRQSKGEDRPVQSQEVRAAHVARHADIAFIFDEENPCAFLKDIRPHVHVNAETYGEDCVEADVLKEIGAKLVLITVRKELGSTTDILNQS